MEIKIKSLHPGAKMPAYATADAACFDPLGHRTFVLK